MRLPHILWRILNPLSHALRDSSPLGRLAGGYYPPLRFVIYINGLLRHIVRNKDGSIPILWRLRAVNGWRIASP